MYILNHNVGLMGFIEGYHVLGTMCHGCGLRVSNTHVTFMSTGDKHQSVYVSGCYGDLVWDGYRILFIGVGMH